MIYAKLDARKFKRELQKMEKKVKNPRKLFNEISIEEIEDAQTRIRTKKTDADGQKWRPWAYSTMKQRRQQGDAGRGLLYKSGLLYRSFVKKIERMKMLVTNKAPYAGYLQFGTRNMPAREILGWGKDARKRVERNVVEYFKK